MSRKALIALTRLEGVIVCFILPALLIAVVLASLKTIVQSGWWPRILVGSGLIVILAYSFAIALATVRHYGLTARAKLVSGRATPRAWEIASVVFDVAKTLACFGMAVAPTGPELIQPFFATTYLGLPTGVAFLSCAGLASVLGQIGEAIVTAKTYSHPALWSRVKWLVITGMTVAAGISQLYWPQIGGWSFPWRAGCAVVLILLGLTAIAKVENLSKQVYPKAKSD